MRYVRIREPFEETKFIIKRKPSSNNYKISEYVEVVLLICIFSSIKEKMLSYILGEWCGNFLNVLFWNLSSFTILICIWKKSEKWLFGSAGLFYNIMSNTAKIQFQKLFWFYLVFAYPKERICIDF